MSGGIHLTRCDTVCDTWSFSQTVFEPRIEEKVTATPLQTPLGLWPPTLWIFHMSPSSNLYEVVGLVSRHQHSAEMGWGGSEKQGYNDEALYASRHRALAEANKGWTNGISIMVCSVRTAVCRAVFCSRWFLSCQISQIINLYLRNWHVFLSLGWAWLSCSCFVLLADDHAP